MTADGMIVSGVGGFYQVLVDGRTICCRLRGRFRQQRDAVLVGDRVQIALTGDSTGLVEEIYPRVSQLKRPPIANVDLVLVVAAAAEPSPDLLMLDRIIVQSVHSGMEVAVCVNKSDLDQARAQTTAAVYQPHFPTFVVSAFQKSGLESVRRIVQGRLCTMAGPSGAGKSSLLNALDPSLDLITDRLSRKIQRGRHTTRSVTLLPIGQGLVADTPGFSRLEVPQMEAVELANCFPEFDAVATQCQFTGCLHNKEPGCAVKDAVTSGLVHHQRYQNYLVFLKELLERRPY